MVKIVLNPRIAFFLIAMGMLSAMALEAPVMLSDIRLQCSQRGCAMAVVGSTGFELSVVSVKNDAIGTQITLRCPATTWGGSGISYSAFPKTSPFRSIALVNNTARKSTDIVVATSLRLNPAIEAKQKVNQWFLLLGSKPLADYSWQASKVVMDKAPIPSNVAVAPIVKAPLQQSVANKSTLPEPTQITSSPSKISPDTAFKKPIQKQVVQPILLKEITGIGRPSVQTLVFEFDAVPSLSSKTADGVLTLAVTSAKSGVAKTTYKLDKQMPFLSVALSDTLKSNAQWLIIRIKMVKNSNPLVSINGKFCRIAAPVSDSIPSVGIWSSNNGTELSYSFAVLPLLPSPLPQIGKKATNDEKIQLSTDQTFEVKKGSPKPPPPAPLPKKAPEVVAPKPIIPPVAPAIPIKKEVVYKRGFVVKDSIYLRTRTASVDPKTVVRQLTIGTPAVIIESKNGFSYIRLSDTVGFVKATFIAESSMVTTAQWQKIFVARQVAFEKAQKSQKAYTNTLIHNAPSKPLVTGQPQSPLQKPTIEIPSGSGVAAEMASAITKPDSVRYVKYGRDPFEPLSNSPEGTSELGVVDNMNLVGVLFDKKDRVALLEDKLHIGKAYALREGDRVHNGKVLNIQKDTVVFLITEYGISHTVVRKLDTRRSLQDSQ